MSFESSIWTWLHGVYTDGEHLYTAAANAMPPTLNIGQDAVALRTVTDQAWNLAYDASPLGYLASLWHGLSVANPQNFASSWPLANQDLISGGYMTNPPLVIPNAYRCAIQMVCGGRPIVNVIGLLGSSAGQSATAAAAVKAAWEGTGKPLGMMFPGVTMTGYSVMDLSTTTGAVALLTSTTAGGGSGTLGDRGACALVKFSGGTRSRTSNGRLFFGPLRSSDIGADGVTLVAGTVTNLTNAMTAMQNSLVTAGFPMAVLSRKTASAHVIQSMLVESIIATQRRRIRGG